MVLHFNVTKEGRKVIVQAIEKELGVKAQYLGVPSCDYQVDIFTISKDGTLSWEDFNDTDINKSSRVIDACVMATGVSPTEWDDNEKEVKEASCEPQNGGDGRENFGLRVSIPLEKVDMGNLISLLEAKGELIKKALGIENTFITERDETVEFAWFDKVTPDEALTYTRFITALCEMSINQKRITAKPRKDENEKYAFRCFLLRLGFIGDEFKADRKLLLSKLDGSSAFKAGTKKGGEQ